MNLLESLKHNIAAALSDTKPYDLPIVCTSLGLADGDQQEAYASKFARASFQDYGNSFHNVRLKAVVATLSMPAIALKTG